MVVELGEGIDPALNGRVLALDDLLRERPFDGYLEAVPTYGSLLVLVDPSQVEYEHAEAELMALAERPTPILLRRDVCIVSRRCTTVPIWNP